MKVGMKRCFVHAIWRKKTLPAEGPLQPQAQAPVIAEQQQPAVLPVSVTAAVAAQRAPPASPVPAVPPPAAAAADPPVVQDEPPRSR